MTVIFIDPEAYIKKKNRLKIGIIIDLVMFALIILLFNIGLPQFYINCLYVSTLVVLIITALWVDYV